MFFILEYTCINSYQLPALHFWALIARTLCRTCGLKQHEKLKSPKRWSVEKYQALQSFQLPGIVANGSIRHTWKNQSSQLCIVILSLRKTEICSLVKQLPTGSSLQPSGRQAIRNLQKPWEFFTFIHFYHLLSPILYPSYAATPIPSIPHPQRAQRPGGSPCDNWDSVGGPPYWGWLPVCDPSIAGLGRGALDRWMVGWMAK